MAVRFKPVKVARFATGDVMVLGWEEGNLLPVLAIVKEDGSIRRFVDLDAIRAGAANGDLMRSAEEIVKRELASLESLRGATFVADGDEVLLTWPGSTRPIVALGAFGEARVIPIMIPNGYVLNDVLGSSGGRWPLVVRVKDADQRPAPAAEDAAKPVKMLLLEYDSMHGTLIRRIAFDKPQVSEVTCAPNSSLTAVFYDTIPDASNGSAATQLVVATGRR
jgi:hypothetical protein